MTDPRTVATRLGGDADFAAPAELIGHPARATMLLALLDGRALPMSVLATEAGIAAPTASEHLGKLVTGGLLRTRREGRHRYYELASAAVAETLEQLSTLAPPRPVRSLRAGTRANALRFARTCYDHLAGSLGVALMGSLLEQGAVTGGDGRHREGDGDRLSAPGRALEYRLTDKAYTLLDELGAELPKTGRRWIGYCVDWTEQRHHLAGAFGAVLLRTCETKGWIVRDARGIRRAVELTDTGRTAFAKYFDIELSEHPSVA